MTEPATSRDILAGDDLSAHAELLLSLLSDSAAGKELSLVIGDVARITIAGGIGNPHIKKLAYDLCKTVPLSDADCEAVVEGVKLDIASGYEASQVTALDYLPFLPPLHLVKLVDRGELASLVEAQAQSSSADVRSAAVAALGAVLSNAEVQETIAASTGLAADLPSWWDTVSDALLDNAPRVVAAGLHAVDKLFFQSNSLARKTPRGKLMHHNSVRTVERICGCLGDLISGWHRLAVPAQAVTARVCGHLAAHLLRDSEEVSSLKETKSAYESGALSVSVSTISSYLLGLLSSPHAPVKMEAAKVLLEMSDMAAKCRGIKPLEQATALPASSSVAAVQALIELRHLPLVEPALEEIVALAASHLHVLPVGSRLTVLAQLWPLIAELPSPTDRLLALSRSWSAALALHLATKEAQSRGEELQAATLTDIFEFPFIQEIMKERPPTRHASMAGDAGSMGGAPQSAVSPVAASPHDPPPPPGGVGALFIPETNDPSGGPGSSQSSQAGSLGGAPSFLAQGSRKFLASTPSKIMSGASGVLSSTTEVFSSATRTLLEKAGVQFWSDQNNRALPPTLKQEILATLLQVLSSHSYASLADELGPPPEVSQDSTLAAWAQRQAQAVFWVGAAVVVLENTKGCLLWEPVINPPIPGQPPPPPLAAKATVNLTTIPADMWLQLMQQCCQVIRKLLACHGFNNLVGLYKSNNGKMLDKLAASDNGSLAKALEEAAVGVQQMLQKIMTEWRYLAYARRPRALWVVAHYLDLPVILDETWAQLLGCVEDLLIRSFKMDKDGHIRQLAVSAREGVLSKALTAKDKDKAPFDAAVASALVELPEYRLDGLLVGLVVVQYLVTLVHDALGGSGQTPGLAQQTLIKRLSELVKQVSLLDTTGADMKEWCRRVSRMLSFMADPGQAVQASGGPSAQPTTRPGVYNQLGFGGGDSSDEESEAPATPAREATPRRSSANGHAGNTPGSATKSPADAGKTQEGSAAPSTLVTQSTRWGYPFSGPRTSVMFMSRRSRRHRLLQHQLNSVFNGDMMNHKQDPSSLSFSPGPIFHPSSGFRLDKQSFWQHIDGAGWQALSGPSDPILLSGWYEVDRDDPTTILVTLKAYNRLEVDLQGAEVQIRLSGPIVAERRAAGWPIPRLLPTEAADYQFKLKVTGYSKMQVHCRVHLPAGGVVRADVGPTILSCPPLSLSLASVLQKHPSCRGPQGFFSIWNTLPVKLQVSGVCVWPGIEGVLLLLSALAALPLTCVWLQNLPALGGCQGAYVCRPPGQPGDVLSLLLVIQQLPVPRSNSKKKPSKEEEEEKDTEADKKDTEADKKDTEGSAKDATEEVLPELYGVCQLYIRSTSQEVAHTVKSHLQDFVRDISLGTLAPGLHPPATAACPKPLMDPSIAVFQGPYMDKSLTWLKSRGATPQGKAGKKKKKGKEEEEDKGDEEQEVDVAWIREAALKEWQRISSP